MIPVYNEAANLEASITTLRRYLDETFPFRTIVTIADNGSTDGTALVAQRLASTLDGVQAMILSRKGRGFALRTAWSASEAEVVAYMDVDLSTSLSALLPPRRLRALGAQRPRGRHPPRPGLRVVRGPKRELISRAYSRIVRALAAEPASPTSSAASRPSGASGRCRSCRSSRTTSGFSTPSSS